MAPAAAAAAAAPPAAGPATVPEADASPAELKRQLANARAELAASLNRKKTIDRNLASLEATLYAFETSYLAPPADSQALGNVVQGYDNYLKALSATTLGPYDRKRTRAGGAHDVREDQRLFSRSSETYQRSLELKERDISASSDDEPSNKRRRMR